MNLFDKICAVLAFLLGGMLILLGVVGVFAGSSAHFTLPPILGGLPLLIGWGIVKPIVVAWRTSPPEKDLPEVRLSDDHRVEQDLPCRHCRYNLRTLDVNADCPECGIAVLRSIIYWETQRRPR